MPPPPGISDASSEGADVSSDGTDHGEDGTSASSDVTDAGDDKTGGTRTDGDAARPEDGVSVLQYHKHLSRDGLYIDPVFTKAASAKLQSDPMFHAVMQGPTYAHPLYLEKGSNNRDVVFVATERNIVLAFDAVTGSTVWQKSLGAPVSLSSLPCGNIDPLGITGTPAIDAASKTLFVDAMTTPDGGVTKKHLVYALATDDGSVRAGWPIDLSAKVTSGALAFDSAVQNQRGALLILNGVLYVPFGAHGGDCGPYHGWVVGIRIDDPSQIHAFATAADRGGIWGTGGLASDGTFVFAATGNTWHTTTWAHGEAVLRLSAGPAFSGQTDDYFAPSNWLDLDNADLDLGGSAPTLVDAPGATPSALVASFGKNGVAYLADRNKLGGVAAGDGMTGEGVASAKVATSAIIQAATTYTTANGTYLVIKAHGIGCTLPTDNFLALKLGATSPPSISFAWCKRVVGEGSPIVTTIDGHSEFVVWGLGAEGDNRLLGFDGDTGEEVFGGGGLAEAMTHIRSNSSPIIVKGRLFVAADDQLYAFTTQ